MLKRIALIGLGGFGLFIFILLFRTFTYGGAPDAVRDITLSPTPIIDASEAAQHLSEAIQFRTITLQSGDPRPGQEGPWLDMQAWLVETCPNFHAAATV